MGVGGAEAEDGVVPESVVEAMGRTLSGIRDLESNMRQFLAMAEPDVLAELPPLHRAQVFLVLAKCASVLFSGASPLPFPSIRPPRSRLL